MEDTTKKNDPSLPPNYVSLADLKQRWLDNKKQQELKREKEEEAKKREKLKDQHQQQQVNRGEIVEGNVEKMRNCGASNPNFENRRSCGDFHGFNWRRKEAVRIDEVSVVKRRGLKVYDRRNGVKEVKKVRELKTEKIESRDEQFEDHRSKALRFYGPDRGLEVRSGGEVKEKLVKTDVKVLQSKVKEIDDRDQELEVRNGGEVKEISVRKVSQSKVMEVDDRDRGLEVRNGGEVKEKSMKKSKKKKKKKKVSRLKVSEIDDRGRKDENENGGETVKVKVMDENEMNSNNKKNRNKKYRKRRSATIESREHKESKLEDMEEEEKEVINPLVAEIKTTVEIGLETKVSKRINVICGEGGENGVEGRRSEVREWRVAGDRARVITRWFKGLSVGGSRRMYRGYGRGEHGGMMERKRGCDHGLVWVRKEEVSEVNSVK